MMIRVICFSFCETEIHSPLKYTNRDNDMQPATEIKHFFLLF